MADVSKLTVHTITNNWHGKRPRKPLVQVFHSGSFYQMNSFSFHPKDAGKIIAAIRLAARSATDGKKRKAIKIELYEDERP